MALLVYGLAKSPATRKAQRYFKERRIGFAFHDLHRRPLAAGELRRFVQRLGVEALMDTDASIYAEQGWAWLAGDDERCIERLCAQPTGLRLPLVRADGEMAVGDDLEGWRRCAQAGKG